LIVPGSHDDLRNENYGRYVTPEKKIESHIMPEDDKGENDEDTEKFVVFSSHWYVDVS